MTCDDERELIAACEHCSCEHCRPEVGAAGKQEQAASAFAHLSLQQAAAAGQLHLAGWLCNALLPGMTHAPGTAAAQRQAAACYREAPQHGWRTSP